MLARDDRTDGGPARLTPRERDVARLVQAGASDAEIAQRLAMSPKTASVHVSTIKRKYAVETRLELALALSAEEP